DLHVARGSGRFPIVVAGLPATIVQSPISRIATTRAPTAANAPILTPGFTKASIEAPLPIQIRALMKIGLSTIMRSCALNSRWLQNRQPQKLRELILNKG